MNDDNRLVDEYEKLQNLKIEIEKKEAELKSKIIELAKEKNTEILLGTNKICSIKVYNKVVYPEDKTLLLSLIKSKGMYDSLSSLNYFKLSPKILKNEVDEDIMALIKKDKAFRVVLKDKHT